MANTKIDELCEYLSANKAKVYPIENDMLKSATDFVVNGYLKMLGVILQQPSEITEAQLAIYKRIIAGSESEKNAEDYLRMALEIEIEDYINFTNEIKDLPLKYRFLLDALILTCISDKNQEQIKLVAEFSEALSIERVELEYITTMAKAILCLDTSMYVDACEIENVFIPEEVFYGYIRLLSQGCIIHNNDMTIFQPSCEEDVTVERLSQISNIDTSIIKLCNVRVNLSEYPLLFSNRNKVIIDGCEFIGGSKHSIGFDNCENVIIRNTSFLDFTVQTVMLNRVNEMKFINTEFVRCRMTYSNAMHDWIALGGVIYSFNSNDSCPIDIDGCLFEDCGGRNSANYYRSAFISNSKCNVNKTRFVNCWHYNNNSEIDPENEKRTMFAKGSSATQCTYENSAAFC